MNKTPLYDEHLRLDATMTEFAGWGMPVYYSGIGEEVAAVRKHAGIFDLCHMGELEVSGLQSLDLLQYTLTNDVSRVAEGRAQYNLMCNSGGGILDDLIVYHLEKDRYLLVVNAANTQSDSTWMASHNDLSADFTERSEATGLIGIQGPDSGSVLHAILDFDPSRMQRFDVASASIGSIHVWVAATGYTGGPGFELFCHAEDTVTLWRKLLESGREFDVLPAGLGARDVLRIEAGYPLYGNELSRDTTPVEAGLSWVVKLAKGDFIGREGISEVRQRGAERKLVGVEAIDRCIPRHGYQLTISGDLAGIVTSGTFSPTLGKGIAMAYVPPQIRIGDVLSLDVRGKACAVTVVSMPFYRGES